MRNWFSRGHLDQESENDFFCCGYSRENVLFFVAISRSLLISFSRAAKAACPKYSDAPQDIVKRAIKPCFHLILLTFPRGRNCKFRCQLGVQFFRLLKASRTDLGAKRHARKDTRLTFKENISRLSSAYSCP